MNLLATLAAALGLGLGSALLPVINAEAFALGAAATPWMIAVVVALAVGQTAGKLVLFESARRGSRRWADRHTDAGRSEGSAPAARIRRWSARLTRGMASDRTGAPLVLVAAAVGLPPLALVSIAAGSAGQRRWLFALLCLLGRTARFTALALPAAAVLR